MMKAELKDEIIEYIYAEWYDNGYNEGVGVSKSPFYKLALNTTWCVMWIAMWMLIWLTIANIYFTANSVW